MASVVATLSSIPIWFRIREKGTNVLGKWGKSWLPPHEGLHSSHGQLYIFRKRRISPFQKCIVFHGYFEGIRVAVPCMSVIFPRFRSTLVPFSQIRNHIALWWHCCKMMNKGTGFLHMVLMGSTAPLGGFNRYYDLTLRDIQNRLKCTH